MAKALALLLMAFLCAVLVVWAVMASTLGGGLLAGLLIGGGLTVIARVVWLQRHGNPYTDGVGQLWTAGMAAMMIGVVGLMAVLLKVLS